MSRALYVIRILFKSEANLVTKSQIKIIFFLIFQAVTSIKLSRLSECLVSVSLIDSIESYFYSSNPSFKALMRRNSYLATLCVNNYTLFTFSQRHAVFSLLPSVHVGYEVIKILISVAHSCNLYEVIINAYNLLSEEIISHF